MTKQHRPSQAVSNGGFRMRTAPLFLLGALICSCSSDNSGGAGGAGPLVRLHPMPLEPMVSQLVLNVTGTDPSGQPGKAEMQTFTTGPFDALGVTFPAGTRGMTTYAITVSDSAACSLAAGTAQLNLDSDGVFDLAVTLVATPLCGKAITLSVQVANVQGAAGTVTSTPPGISCTGIGAGCSAVFPNGTPVTLTAQPSGLFSGWTGGGCMGKGDCVLTLSQDTQIEAVFSTCHGWCTEPLPAGITANLNGVAGTASNNVLVVGDMGTALVWNGTAWKKLPLPQNATTNLNAAAASKGTSTTIYAAGDSGLILTLALAGTAFTTITNASTASLRGVAVDPGNTPNIYFVGDTGVGLLLATGDKSVSNKLNAGTALYTISQNPGDTFVEELYIGGAIKNGAGYAQDWDGNKLTAQTGSPGASIAGEIRAMVCGKSTHYAAGAGGAMISRSSMFGPFGNGTNWMAVASGTTKTLRGMWQSADNNVYAVGDAGTIMQYDGTGWAPATSGVQVTLRAVWGTSSNNIYAVGDAGTVLHYVP